MREDRASHSARMISLLVDTIQIAVTLDGHKIVASKLYNYVQRLIARRADASQSGMRGEEFRHWPCQATLLMEGGENI